MKEPKGNPQLEDGFTSIANEIAEAFARIRISGEEWQVLWVILRKTYGWHKKEDWISLSQFAELTKMNKPHIIQAIKKLIKKNVITKKGNGKQTTYGFNKHYDTWQPLPKKVTLPKKVMNVTKNGNDSLPKMVPTKDTTTKETITKDIERKVKREKNLKKRTEITFNGKEFRFEGITKEDIKKWQTACTFDVKRELLQMEIWLKAHKKKRYKNYEAFITGWLLRSQGNYKNNHKKGERYHGITTRLTEEEKQRIKEDEKNGITSWKAGEW